MDQKKLQTVKVMIVGHDQAGKTSLLYRLIDREYNEEKLRSSEVKYSVLDFPDRGYKLQIWGSGKEGFAEVTQAYYRAASIFVIVFDCTDEDSFDRAKTLLQEVRRHNPSGLDILLVANKKDLRNRAVPLEEAEEFAFQNRLMFLDTSVKEESKEVLVEKIQELADKYLMFR
jgi:small GTP-binding protein